MTISVVMHVRSLGHIFVVSAASAAFEGCARCPYLWALGGGACIVHARPSNCVFVTDARMKAISVSFVYPTNQPEIVSVWCQGSWPEALPFVGNVQFNCFVTFSVMDIQFGLHMFCVSLCRARLPAELLLPPHRHTREMSRMLCVDHGL